MKKDAVIEIAPGVEITPEQAEDAAEALSAVNVDEVTIEIIEVKVRHYKEEPVLDDDNQPVLDDDSKPLTYRRAATRTAHIQNFVEWTLYHEVMAEQSKLKNMNLSEQIAMMSEYVLKVWQVSEPFMNKKMLAQGIDLPVIGVLFKRFFDPNRLQKLKV